MRSSKVRLIALTLFMIGPRGDPMELEKLAEGFLVVWVQIDDEMRSPMKQSLRNLLRSVAAQARREGIEEAAKAVQDCPELFFDPLGNRYSTRADLIAAVRVLATEDKETSK